MACRTKLGGGALWPIQSPSVPFHLFYCAPLPTLDPAAPFLAPVTTAKGLPCPSGVTSPLDAAERHLSPSMLTTSRGGSSNRQYAAWWGWCGSRAQDDEVTDRPELERLGVSRGGPPPPPPPESEAGEWPPPTLPAECRGLRSIEPRGDMEVAAGCRGLVAERCCWAATAAAMLLPVGLPNGEESGTGPVVVGGETAVATTAAADTSAILSLGGGSNGWASAGTVHLACCSRAARTDVGLQGMPAVHSSTSRCSTTSRHGGVQAGWL